MDDTSQDSDFSYRLLVESIVDLGIVLLDPGGAVRSWNQGARHIYGYATHEILGQNFAILFCEEERQANAPQASLQEAAGRGSCSREVTRARRDGSKFCAQVTLYAIRSADGVLVGFSDVTRELTEGNALADQAALMKLYDTSPDAVLIVNSEGRIVSLNRRTVALFGYSREELLNESVELLMPQRLRKRHEAHRVQYIEHPRLREMGEGMTLLGRRSDGSEFPVEIQVGPVRVGTATLVLTIIRDVSEREATVEALASAERKRLRLEEQRRLAEERQRWSDAFENASFGIAVTDAESHLIRFANPAFAAMRQMSVEEMQSMSLLEMHPPLERERILALLARGDKFGRVSYEALQTRKDGSVLPVHVDVTSVSDASGQILYRIVSALDITERRQTEDALRQSQKMEAIGNLTGGLAHDFNILLGVVIGNLDLLRSSPTAASAGEDPLGEALDAALKGADLTRRLLAFARRQPLQPARLVVNELVQGLGKLLRRTLGENIAVSLDLAEDLPSVVVDPVQLEACLVNLATNARDAMPNGGQLSLATAVRILDSDYVLSHPEVVPGDYVVIEVSDTGVGIDPVVLGRIFEPFFTTKERGKGTGLGLSMVFGFVKQSGGHVTVYSQVGVGTTFRLYLARSDLEERESVPEEPRSARRGSGETVLAVEDNDALRRIVVRQLQSLGYRALEANQASAALAILETEPVDVLFTDVVMPGDIDGVELARRALVRWPDLRVLLTSGFPEARFRGCWAALNSSVRLLNKPYRAQDLGNLLREVLTG